MWPDWITGLFEFALRAESDVALRLQIGKKTGPGCISPCDKVIIWYTFYFVLIFFLFLFFFFPIVHPWASLWIFDICLTLRNFEELWHACGEYTAQSKSSTVETRFTCAMIKSHHSPRCCVSALNCFQSGDTNCLTSINKMCSLALAWVRYWNC